MSAGANAFGMPDPSVTAQRLMALGRHLAATRGGATIEIATAPRDEIWRDGKIRLHRYRPVAPSSSNAGPKLGPMLILHGLVGRVAVG